MVVIQLIELAAGGRHAGAVQRGRRVRVDVRPRDQPEPPEQPLLRPGELLVGQVERGRHRQVLGAHHGQPVARRGQPGRLFRAGPGRVMPQLPGQHPDGQRQVPAEPGYLPGRAGRVGQLRAARQLGQQRRRLVRGQRVQADHRRVVQRGQPAAAGDQDQAAGRAGEQRLNLLVPGGVIEHQQDFPARDVVPPAACPGLQARRHLLGRDPGGEQQAGQRVGRVHRALPGRVPVQRQEELPVREPAGQLVRGVHRERGLADAGHPVDRVDAHDPAVGRAGQRAQQPGEFGLAAGEPADIARQRPGGGRGRRRAVRRGLPGGQHLGGRCPAAGRRDEHHPHVPAQLERVRQQLGAFLAGGPVDAPLQVTDRARAQAGRLGQFLLGQPGLGTQLAQQLGEPQLRPSAPSPQPGTPRQSGRLSYPALPTGPTSEERVRRGSRRAEGGAPPNWTEEGGSEERATERRELGGIAPPEAQASRARLSDEGGGSSAPEAQNNTLWLWISYGRHRSWGADSGLSSRSGPGVPAGYGGLPTPSRAMRWRSKRWPRTRRATRWPRPGSGWWRAPCCSSPIPASARSGSSARRNCPMAARSPTWSAT